MKMIRTFTQFIDAIRSKQQFQVYENAQWVDSTRIKSIYMGQPLQEDATSMPRFCFTAKNIQHLDILMGRSLLRIKEPEILVLYESIDEQGDEYWSENNDNSISYTGRKITGTVEAMK